MSRWNLLGGRGRSARKAKVNQDYKLRRAVVETLEERRLLTILATSQYGFDFETGHKVNVTFNQSVTSAEDDFTPGDVTFTDLTTGQQYAANQLSVTNTSGNSYSITFPGSNGGLLPDGWYEMVLNKEQILGVTGGRFSSDRRITFFVFTGDVNRDRVVDQVDFDIVLSNGGTNATYSSGDTNYDGSVDLLDLNNVLNHFSATLPSLPTQPGSPRAYALSDASIRTFWNPFQLYDENGDLYWPDAHHIYRSTDGVNFTQVGTAAGDAYDFVDTGLIAGTKYWYRVRSYTAAQGESAAITKYSAVTILPAPSDLQVENVSGQPGSVQVSWQQNSNNPATQYVVLWQLPGETYPEHWEEVGNASSAVISGLPEGQAVKFSVYAYTDHNDSGTTPEKAVTVARTAPHVVSTYFNHGLSGQTLQFVFDTSVQASLSTDDLSIVNLTTGEIIPSFKRPFVYYVSQQNIGIFLSVNPPVVPPYPPVYPPQMFGEGDIEVTLNAGGITNAAGVTLNEDTGGGDYRFRYFFLRGDYDNDRDVDDADRTHFDSLYSRYYSETDTSRTYEKGDLTGDYKVTSADLAAFNTNFLRTIAEPPTAPGAVAASAVSSSQISLNWGQVAGVDGYNVYRSTDGTNFAYLTHVAGASTLNYTNTNLAEGTKYWYRIRAVSGTNVSESINKVSAVTLLPAPSDLSLAAASSTSVDVSWTSNSTNQAGFVVEWALPGQSFDGSNTLTVGAGVTSTTITGLTENKTYSIRVYAYNSAIQSGSSASEKISLNPLTPQVTNSEFYYNQAPHQIRFTFNTDVSESLSAAHLTLTNLTLGEVWDVSDWSLSYDPAYNTATFTLLGEAPAILSTGNYEAILAAPAILNRAGASLQGNQDDGNEFAFEFQYLTADGNRDRVIDGLDWDIALTWYGVSSGHATFSQGDYDYDRAVTVADQLLWMSNLSVVLPPPPDQPGEVVVTSLADSYTSLELSWQKVAGVDGYRIYRSTDGTNFAQIATIPDPDAEHHTDTNLIDGTKYWYRIRSYTTAAGNSASVNKAWGITKMRAPTNLEIVELTSDSVTLTWDDNSASEGEYVIERATGEGPFDTQYSVDADSEEAAIDGLSSGTKYRWRVFAKNAMTQSAYSNEVDDFTHLHTVGTQAVIAAAGFSTGTVTLTAFFDESGGEIDDYYANIDWGDGASNSGTIAPGPVGDWLVQGDHTYAAGGLFNINVSIQDYAGATAVGASGADVYEVPELEIAEVDTQSIRFDWAQSLPEPFVYHLQRATGDGDFDTEYSILGTPTDYLVDGLEEGTSYRWGFMATPLGRDPLVINDCTTITKLHRPDQLFIETISDQQATLRWSDISNSEDHFVIERAIDNGPFDFFIETNPNAQDYTVRELSEDTEYRWRMYAANTNAQSDRTAEVVVRTRLSSPDNLEVYMNSSDSVTLAWDDHSNVEQRFIVERATEDNEFDVQYEVAANQTEFSIAGLPVGPKYRSRVHAANDVATSEPTAAVESTTELIRPTNVWASLLEDTGDLRITWENGIPWQDRITIFLYTVDDDGNLSPDPTEVILYEYANSYTFDFDPAGLDQKYAVYVRAHCDGIDSDLSEIAFSGVEQTGDWSRVYTHSFPRTPVYVDDLWAPATWIEPDPQAGTEGWWLLGSYSNETVTLTLNDLPRHTWAKVAFEFVAWDDPDVDEYFTITADGVPVPGGMGTGGEWSTWYYGNSNPDQFKHDSESMTIQIRGSGFTPENLWEVSVVSVHTYLPTVSVSAQGPGVYGNTAFAQEGTPQQPGILGNPNPGWLVQRSSAMPEDLVVKIRSTGDATPNEDYAPLPEEVTIPAGQLSVFLPLYLMEDLTPEYTESVGLVLRPDETYQVPTNEARQAAIDIADDDYFILGNADTPDGTIPYLSGEGDGTDTTQGTADEIEFTDPVGAPHVVAGVFDGDWLPWMQGEEEYLEAGGSASNPMASDLLTLLLDHEGTEGPLVDDEGNPIEFAGAGALEAAAMERNLRIGQMLAILEEHKNADGSAFKFEYFPELNLYVGRDPEGRQTWFKPDMTEVRYIGTGKMWYLRFNDDGSVDRITNRYKENDFIEEEIRPSDKLRKELQGYFADALEQEQEDEERRQRLANLSNALTEVLDAALRMLPGALVLDLEQALTGENALKPGQELSGGEQAASIGNAVMPAAIMAAAKITKVLKAFREGKKFEEETIKTLEELSQIVENGYELHKYFRVELPTGKVRRTFPDIVTVVGTNTMIEIKRVASLGVTRQFEAQVEACLQHDLNYRIIVADDVFQGGISGGLAQMLDDLRDAGRRVTVETLDTNTKTLRILWPVE